MIPLDRPGPIVEIEWSDIETTVGWRSKEELDKVKTEPMAPCISVGYLVADEDDRVVIVQSATSDSHSERTVIPKSVITNFTRWPKSVMRKSKKRL